MGQRVAEAPEALHVSESSGLLPELGKEQWRSVQFPAPAWSPEPARILHGLVDPCRRIRAPRSSSLSRRPGLSIAAAFGLLAPGGRLRAPRSTCSLARRPPARERALQSRAADPP